MECWNRVYLHQKKQHKVQDAYMRNWGFKTAIFLRRKQKENL